MKIKLILFLFITFSLYGQENFQHIDVQGEALWEARDFNGASEIYQGLLTLSLPRWQQARLFYNLGTIRLSQNRTLDAFDFFKKVLPTELSLPQFGANLFINMGIAYLQYAETLSSSISSLDEQALLIEQSLNAFKVANALDCQEAAIDTECHTRSLIEFKVLEALSQRKKVYQQKRHNWLEKASERALAILLHRGINETIQKLNEFQKLDDSLKSYFQHQIETLLPIWNMLQQRLSDDKKTNFDVSLSSYLKALNHLSQNDVNLTLEELNKTVQTITPFGFEENDFIEQIYLDYSLLLLQESISISQLNQLIHQFEEFSIKETNNPTIEKIKGVLQISLKALEDSSMHQAQFYLLTGINLLQSLVNKAPVTSIIILQNSLSQAEIALQMFLLMETMDEKAFNLSNILPILQNQHSSLLKYAMLFIPQVLKEQKNRYQQGSDSSCQQSPWDQVILLFYSGNQSAQEVETYLRTSQFNPQEVLNLQKETVKNWQKALHFMLYPPKQPLPSKGVSRFESASQNLTETFRIIQEMFLQDQSKPQQQIEELHTW